MPKKMTLRQYEKYLDEKSRSGQEITMEDRRILGEYHKKRDMQWRKAALILAPTALAVSLIRLLLQVLSMI